MSHKVNIFSAGRDVYFTPAGRDNFTGLSIENSVSTPSRAIEVASSLTPPPATFTPATIVAAESGVFFESIVMPTSVQAACEFSALVSSDPVTLTAGNTQLHEWGAIINQVDNGIGVMIDGKIQIKMTVGTITIGSDTLNTTGSINNIAYKVTGSCDDIFIIESQLKMRGLGAIGIDHTATSPTPINYKFTNVEFFNQNQTFCRMNTVDPLEQVQLALTTVQEGNSPTQPTTGSIVLDVMSGILNVTGQSLRGDYIAKVRDGGNLALMANFTEGDLIVEDGGDAVINGVGLFFGDTTVESGGFLQLVIGVYSGDITVDAGGLLDVIILSHVPGGTLTFNGTVNGVINGKCYGTYCEVDITDPITAPQHTITTEEILLVDPTANTVELDLPAIADRSNTGRSFPITIRNISTSNAFRANINPDGIETVNRVATIQLKRGESVTLAPRVDNWWSVST